MELSAVVGPCLHVQSKDCPNILLSDNQPTLETLCTGFINFVNTLGVDVRSNSRQVNLKYFSSQRNVRSVWWLEWIGKHPLSLS